MLNCGRIKYTNDLPIYAAFDEGVIEYPGKLHADVPSRLNEMMREGLLDVGPISAFAYAQDADRYVLLPDLCIGAREEVISVVLVSTVPPALLDGAEIAVTPESATGRNLLRVLLERRYGVHAQFVDRGDTAAAALSGQPALLIGDSAIDAMLSLPVEQVYDLGTLWHDWTGEQTVFAVWVARRDVYEREPDAVRGCMHTLTDAYTWARLPTPGACSSTRTTPSPTSSTRRSTTPTSATCTALSARFSVPRSTAKATRCRTTRCCRA